MFSTWPVFFHFLSCDDSSLLDALLGHQKAWHLALAFVIETNVVLKKG